MKKLVGGGAGILAIVAYIVVKVLIGSAIRGNNVDPTGLEFRLMVNKVIEAIELKDYAEQMEAKEIALNEYYDSKSETDEENQTRESEESDEFVYYYDQYGFMEKFTNVNLFKNEEFAKYVNLNMNVFNNEELAKLPNIDIKFQFGIKDENGDYTNKLYMLSVQYADPDNGSKVTGRFDSRMDGSNRFGSLAYNFYDVIPVYKDVVGHMIKSIENYKASNNNDLSLLDTNSNTSLFPVDPLSEELDFDSFVWRSDIWEYPEDQKINLVFDKENGTGDGKDGNYRIKISFTVMDDKNTSKEKFGGEYISATKKWTGDFKD